MIVKKEKRGKWKRMIKSVKGSVKKKRGKWKMMMMMKRGKRDVDIVGDCFTIKLFTTKIINCADYNFDESLYIDKECKKLKLQK